MQHDDTIWSVINHHACGECSCIGATCHSSRPGCPLANGRYATIREDDGVCYLLIKTVERAHTLLHLWEKIKLSRNLEQAFERIDRELMYWPRWNVHKVKQRLLKTTQYLTRMRRLQLKAGRKKLVGIKKKIVRRERTREAKAEVAAHLDRSIESELLERLRSGVYGDIYNISPNAFEKALDEEGGVREEEEEDELDYDSQDEEEEEEEIEYVEGDFEDDFEDLIDSDEEAPVKRPADEDAPPGEPSTKTPRRSSRRRGGHVEVEYEREEEGVPLM